MITIECPWCDGPVAMETTDEDELMCDACVVRFELAPDRPASLADAA